MRDTLSLSFFVMPVAVHVGVQHHIEGGGEEFCIAMVLFGMYNVQFYRVPSEALQELPQRTVRTLQRIPQGTQG